jgi:mitotic spindle assembly checkpoint protein MAD1
MVFRVNPPKVGATGNETGGTVELLPTPYTSTDELRRMIDMYVGKWSSVPGFVANLTIELFNKQTAA